MKKILLFSASAILATSVLAFSACGSKGAISGNYKDATQEEILTEISQIDTEKAFESLKGFESSAQFNLSFVMGENKITASANETFKLTYEATEEGLNLAGSGNGSVKYDVNMGENSQAGNYSAKVYIDSENVYFDVTGDDEPVKGKVSLEDIFDMIDDNMPFAVDEVEGDEDFDVTIPSQDSDGIFEILDNYNFKYSMDNSNGLKIKVSIPEESLWKIIESSDFAGSYVTLMKNLITFNTYTLDAYIAFDSEGVFSQLSLDVNIDASIESSNSGAEGTDMSCKLSGYFILKAYNGKVTLPSGLATDETYENILK